MGKMQLSVPVEEQKKAEVAAHFSGININEAVAVGKELIMDVTYRAGNQLVNFGRKLEQVKGDELDALKKARAEKEKATAKK